MSWGHITSHVMDLIWSEQFYIITYPEIYLVISYLTYLIFQINFLDQPFNQPTQSTYSLNWRRHGLGVYCFLWQTCVRKRVYSYILRYVWFKWLTFLQITHLSKREVYHPWASLGGDIDKSPTGRSEDFSFVRTLTLFFFYECQGIDWKEQKSFGG